jgi:hypothetical protein
MKEIQVDFLPGTHGHFLTFVLDKLLLGDKITQTSPFTSIGTSHGFWDIGYPVTAGHWSVPEMPAKWWKVEGKPDLGNNIILIAVRDSDIIPMVQLGFLRASDNNCDLNDLEIDTYNKILKLKYGRFHDIIINLNLTLEKPDCPRELLRHYFKEKFVSFLKKESTHPWVREFKSYSQFRKFEKRNVFYFPYSDFYDHDKFLNNIREIQVFFNLEFKDFNVANLHQQFLKNQPCRDSVEKIEKILRDISDRKEEIFPSLNIIEEAYIDSKIEEMSGFIDKLPIGPSEFPRSVNELVKQYGLNK